MRILPGTVSGTLAAPPSKSHTHRAFILAALSGNGSIRHVLESDDTKATLDCLSKIGFLSTMLPHETRVGGTFRAPKEPLNARESGTTLRLMTAVASLQSGEARFVAAPGLAKRPMRPLLEALPPLGVEVAAATGAPPFSVRGPLQGGETKIRGDVSSQFLSALLLACPVAPKTTTIGVEGAITSRPYVDITLHQLKHHGVEVEETARGFRIQGMQRIKQKPYDVPGDYSSAAFLLSAAAMTGGEVVLENLPRDDPQGDRAIIHFLQRFGSAVQADERRVIVRGGSPLKAQEIDVGAVPDLFPVLCALAAVAKGRSRLFGAPHLRAKESDRIHSMAVNLQNAGINVRELPDGIEIEGGTPKGTTIQSFGDHRIAMAMSVLATCASQPSQLDDDHVVAKSYPGFFVDLKRLAPEVVA